MDPAGRQELVYIPGTRNGDRGPFSGARSATRGAGDGFRGDEPVWAYCRELCGPAACDRAVGAILKALEDEPDAITIDELLLMTRGAAAQFAVAGMKGSGENLSAQVDPTCAKTPARLAASLRHGLRPVEQHDLGEHLKVCLLCQAIRLRMDRAERAFAALSAPDVACEAEFAAKERPRPTRDGPAAPTFVERSFPAQLSSGRASSAVRAYCRELCGPVGSVRAIAESLAAAGIGATFTTVGAPELLRVTRIAAAKQALIDVDERLSRENPWAPRDAVCAMTPMRLSAVANGELELYEEFELEQHIEQCWVCRALRIKMNRAERAYATMASGPVGIELDRVTRAERVDPSATASGPRRTTSRGAARSLTPAALERQRQERGIAASPRQREIRKRRLVATAAVLIACAVTAVSALALRGAFSTARAPARIPAAAKSSRAVPAAAASAAAVSRPAAKTKPATHQARRAPHHAVRAHHTAKLNHHRPPAPKHTAAPAATSAPAPSPVVAPPAPSPAASAPVASKPSSVSKPSTPSVTPQGTNLPAQSAPTQGIGPSGG